MSIEIDSSYFVGSIQANCFLINVCEIVSECVTLIIIVIPVFMLYVCNSFYCIF